MLDAALREFALAVLELLCPRIAQQAAGDLDDGDAALLARDVELLTGMIAPAGQRARQDRPAPLHVQMHVHAA